ncbi:hypothetical protein [Endozoicomonas lisbonensis]|uniref:Uncharacterized protein n=1 Tax=Endozoicomonas lisbonensis TaxID=3120522 RepID=A0ABV2SMT6_9GAMM
MARDLSNLQGIAASEHLISAQPDAAKPDAAKKVPAGTHQHRKVSPSNSEATKGLREGNPKPQKNTLSSRQVTTRSLSKQLNSAGSIEELVNLRSSITSLKPEKQEKLTKTYSSRMEQLIQAETQKASTPSELLKLSDTIASHTPSPRARRRLIQALFSEKIEKQWDKLVADNSDPEQQADLQVLLETLLEHPSLRTSHPKIASYLDQITTEPEAEDDVVYRLLQEQLEKTDSPEPEEKQETAETKKPETVYSWNKIQMEHVQTYPFSHELDSLKEQAYPQPFSREASNFLDRCRKKAKSCNPDDLNLFLLLDFQTWTNSIVEDPAIRTNLEKKLLATAAELFEQQISLKNESESQLNLRDQFEKLLQNTSLPHDQLMPQFEKARRTTAQHTGDDPDSWGQQLTVLKSGHGNLLALSSLITSANDKTRKLALLEIFVGQKARLHEDMANIQEQIEASSEAESFADLPKLWNLADKETEYLNNLKGWTTEHVEQARKWLRI